MANPIDAFVSAGIAKSFPNSATGQAFAAAAANARNFKIAASKKIAAKYEYNFDRPHEWNIQQAQSLAQAGRAQTFAKEDYVKLNPAGAGNPKSAAATNLAISASNSRRGGISPVKSGRPTATTLISDTSTVGKKKNALGTKQY